MPHLAIALTLIVHHLRKLVLRVALIQGNAVKDPIRLKDWYRPWHVPCDVPNGMATIRPICPISARSAPRAGRRIAPVAPVTRLTDRGARSSSGVEQSAPQNSGKSSERTRSDVDTYKPAFTSQVLGQLAGPPNKASRHVAQRYEEAERLDAPIWHWLSAQI